MSCQYMIILLLLPKKNIIQFQTIFISASDENDPLFYITTNITEESFRTIKESQDLVVNFDNFPNQIIQLFNNSDTIGDDGPR